MTIGPVSASQRVPAAPARSDAGVNAPDPAKLADEFAAAARRGGAAMLPASARTPKLTTSRAEVLADEGTAIAPQTATAQATAGQVTTAPALSRAYDNGRQTHRLAEVRHEEPTSGGLADAYAIPVVAAATPPPPPAAQVDAAHFADMLTQLWSREQSGISQEMRVSFGDEAWPATGARLLRLADGSLQITVAVGQDRAAIATQLASLRERLKARGLAVAGVTVEDDDTA